MAQEPLPLHPLPTAAEVLAALDSLEPHITSKRGRRAYAFALVYKALFPPGDERLKRPAGQPHGKHYSPAYRFMLDLELGKIVKGVSGGGSSGLWREPDASA